MVGEWYQANGKLNRAPGKPCENHGYNKCTPTNKHESIVREKNGSWTNLWSRLGFVHVKSLDLTGDFTSSIIDRKYWAIPSKSNSLQTRFTLVHRWIKIVSRGCHFGNILTANHKLEARLEFLEGDSGTSPRVITWQTFDFEWVNNGRFLLSRA